MEFLFEHIPIAVLILGFCILMRYPYIGAGLMLAVLCFEVEQYLLAAGCLAIGLAMHTVMARRIRPQKGAVGESRASRRARRRGEEEGREGGKDVSET